ncbi:alpha-1,2-fucosyltransferase [Steroidobacter sp. S1-65]|uniref:Alpha-1,2-fucosyltransferase n=1 Tax=Steroidobacter gossypii TaxID=2805490 RepID=A0ABS1WYV8_9GAMM|nr:alpha-1,2-fucosyltransferase [Steroidobacter gossypii]MBM0106161.1 alpha-1,2-fucosyltransferase [Steroidobacter gossypii]
MACIVRLNGGLGNQLFQYAVGRAVAHKYGCELLLDATLLNTRHASITPRSYELTPFKTVARLMSAEESVRAGLPTTRWDRWLARCGVRLRGRKYLIERGPGYQPAALESGGSLLLEGFWQSERYFSHIRELLLEEISTVDSAQLARASEQVQAEQSVSLHIRRGDYVSNPAAHAFHGVCSTAYYQAGMALLEQRVSRPRYFVFTDDPQWVADNRALFGRDLTIVSGAMQLQPHEEMVLMSRCRHNVIANSSFSWWGAWLNRNPDACVIAPAEWFRHAPDRDVVPTRWQRVG